MLKFEFVHKYWLVHCGDHAKPYKSYGRHLELGLGDLCCFVFVFLIACRDIQLRFFKVKTLFSNAFNNPLTMELKISQDGVYGECMFYFNRTVFKELTWSIPNHLPIQTCTLHIMLHCMLHFNIEVADSVNFEIRFFLHVSLWSEMYIWGRNHNMKI